MDDHEFDEDDGDNSEEDEEESLPPVHQRDGDEKLVHTVCHELGQQLGCQDMMAQISKELTQGMGLFTLGNLRNAAETVVNQALAQVVTPSAISGYRAQLCRMIDIPAFAKPQVNVRQKSKVPEGGKRPPRWETDVSAVEPPMHATMPLPLFAIWGAICSIQPFTPDRVLSRAQFAECTDTWFK